MAFYRSRAFPALAAGLWLGFLFLDLTGMAGSAWVKFAAICLCGATAWTGARTTDGKIVAAALTLTVCADVFLLLLNRDVTDQLIGVSIFLVVQLLYAFRLYRLRGRLCLWGLVPRTILLLLWVGLWVVEPSVPTLWAVLLYFSNLCVNCAEAFALKAERPAGLFKWGLLLFIGCDVCVGGWNISLFLPAAAAEFTRVGMWFFYLPSQVLIVLSQRLEGDPQ